MLPRQRTWSCRAPRQPLSAKQGKRAPRFPQQYLLQAGRSRSLKSPGQSQLPAIASCPPRTGAGDGRTQRSLRSSDWPWHPLWELRWAPQRSGRRHQFASDEAGRGSRLLEAALPQPPPPPRWLALQPSAGHREARPLALQLAAVLPEVLSQKSWPACWPRCRSSQTAPPAARAPCSSPPNCRLSPRVRCRLPPLPPSPAPPAAVVPPRARGRQPSQERQQKHSSPALAQQL